jgi:histidinol-phosphate aminotransferase
MPTFRSDLSNIPRYTPGRPIEEVAEEFGLTEIAKLASNESPLPPFPEVQEAIAAATAGLNRYPDNEKPRLREALSQHLGVPTNQIWTGGASNELMLITALSVGGPGTSSVYSWPAFSLYRIASRAAFAKAFEVPLDEDHRHDLDAMREAVRGDTTVVYVCNPNNPTGTHVPGDALEAFIDSLPERVLVVVDEAYHEYVTAPDYRSMLPLAAERRNVIVTRTFSKIYSLAGLRVGYAVTAANNIPELRRIQLPFSVNTLGEVAATEALKYQARVEERRRSNAQAVSAVSKDLADRGLEVADSQTNFVYTGLGDRAEAVTQGLLERGVIVRPTAIKGWLRIGVGSERENEMLLGALGEVL